MTSKQSLEKVIEILSEIKEILKCSKQEPEVKPTPTPEPKPEISDEEFKNKIIAIVEEYLSEDINLVAVYEAAKQ